MFEPHDIKPTLHSTLLNSFPPLLSNIRLTRCFLLQDQQLRWCCEVRARQFRNPMVATKANFWTSTAKPTSALIPYRSVAAISSSSSKPATAVSPHNVHGNLGTPPPMSVTGKERREVPLPSQEGKKGVMQYALYVPSLVTLYSVTFQEELGVENGMWQAQLRSGANSKPEQLSTK